MSMFYGYVDHRELQGTCIVITAPCTTKTESEQRFVEAFHRLPRNLKVDLFGRRHGTMFVREESPIHIPANKLGIKVSVI